MHQVVLNLVRNAVDALPDGGIVEVTLRSDEGEVTLAVSDDGPGMSAEVRERIFEPFFTTKAKGKGTGLGLYVVHQIVRGHEGWLIVESEPGQGTVFKMTLPPVGKEKLTNPKPVEKVVGDGQTILLVDDDDDVRDVVSQMIASLGYGCIEADSADGAERALGEEGAGIDLVLTDLGMPGRSGLDLARELQKRKPPPKVVVLTGDGIFEQAELSAAGVIATLEKPVTGAMLSETIKMALGALIYLSL